MQKYKDLTDIVGKILDIGIVNWCLPRIYLIFLLKCIFFYKKALFNLKITSFVGKSYFIMKTHLFLAILIVLMSGCSYNYYAPMPQNVPLFRDSSEIRFTVNKGYAEKVSHLGAQAAITLSKQIALMANGNIGVSRKQDHMTTLGSDVGLGWFKAIDDNWTVEAYVVGGLNGLKSKYDDTNLEGRLSSYRLFVQPSIGYRTGRFDFALTPAFGYQQFLRINLYDKGYMKQPLELKPDYVVLDNHKQTLLIEPGLLIRYHWTKYVSPQFQIMHSSRLSHPEIPFGRWNISIGVMFSSEDSSMKNKPIK